MRYLFVLFLALSVFNSCKKEDKAPNSPLAITPSKIIHYSGANWNTIEPEIKGHSNYLYSSLSNSYGIIAAVSVDAIDQNAPVQNVRLLFNINTKNNVVFVGVSKDSITKVQVNNMTLYYYDSTAAHFSDSEIYYIMENNINIKKETLLEKLQNSNATFPVFSYVHNSQHYTIQGYYETNEQKGSFDFYIQEN